MRDTLRFFSLLVVLVLAGCSKGTQPLVTVGAAGGMAVQDAEPPTIIPGYNGIWMLGADAAPSTKNYIAASDGHTFMCRGRTVGKIYECPFPREGGYDTVGHTEPVPVRDGIFDWTHCVAGEYVAVQLALCMIEAAPGTRSETKTIRVQALP